MGDMAYLKAISQQPYQRTEEITKILNQETRWQHESGNSSLGTEFLPDEELWKQSG
jgi:hypothetical protein